MKRTIFRLVLIPVVLALMLPVALNIPTSLATNSDFQVLYYTDQGFTRGIDVYNHEDKIRMISEENGNSPEDVTIPQFAYPPWLSLSTFYLGYLPINAAATLWFEINLLLLFLSVWFLTAAWSLPRRLLAFPAVLVFAPVLGTLAIGQYDFPVLLGTSLLIYAIKKENAILSAIGMSLLTFKPHIGVLILLASLIHLVWRRDAFGRRAIAFAFVAGIVLFLIGFLADASWPIHYLDSLLNYRKLGHINTCSECVSIAIWLTRLTTGQSSLVLASEISGVLLGGILIALALIRPPLWESPNLFLAASLLATFIASPYLYNYDFSLLIVPIFLLAERASSRFEWFWLAASYFFPEIAFLLYGRQGNYSLIFSVLVLALLTYLRARQPHIDVSPTGV